MREELRELQWRRDDLREQLHGKEHVKANKAQDAAKANGHKGEEPRVGLIGSSANRILKSALVQILARSANGCANGRCALELPDAMVDTNLRLG